MGDWPKDPKLAEVGKYVRACLENDIEGKQTRFNCSKLLLNFYLRLYSYDVERCTQVAQG